MTVRVIVNKTSSVKMYPCLMQGKTYSEVILMVSEREGIVISNEMGRFGEYKTNWDENLLEVFKGSITLESH